MSFIIASLVYIAANVVDYFLTISGISCSLLQEGNPIVQGYIDHFGSVHGILLCKSLACTGVLFAMEVAILATGRTRPAYGRSMYCMAARYL